MTKGEVLKLAIEALRNHTLQTRPLFATDSVIADFEAELAKPKPAPVCFLIDESMRLLRVGKTAIAHPTQSGMASYSLPLYSIEDLK